MRFEANYIDVKKMIERGEIGNLRTIRGHLLTSDQRDPASWHSHYETAGGGNMMHDVTHLFDLIRFYAGDPEWVFATVERGNKTLTIEDLGAGLFRMDSDCLFFFESGGRRRYGTFEILIEGDEGRLAIQHGAGNSLERAGGYGWVPYLHRWRMQTEPVAWEPVATQRQHAWVNAVTDLVDCIDQDRESVSSGRQGRAALEMIMAVYESQRQGLARVDFRCRSGTIRSEICSREVRYKDAMPMRPPDLTHQLIYKNPHAYCAWPDIKILHDGEWVLAFCEAMRRPILTHLDPSLLNMLLRSEDGGQSWHGPRVIAGYDFAGMDDPGMVQLSSGVLLVNTARNNFVSLDAADADAAYARYRRSEGFAWAGSFPVAEGTYVHRSDDGGRTWNGSARVDVSPFVSGYTLRPITELEDGSLLLPCYDESQVPVPFICRALLRSGPHMARRTSDRDR